MKKYLASILVASILITIFCVMTLAAMTPHERAEAYYKQGYLYYYEKDYNKAIAEYKKALNLNPNMAKAHYWLGKCYYHVKDYPSATKYIETAMALSPGLEDGPNLLRKIETVESSLPEAKPKAIKPIIVKPESEPKPEPESKPSFTEVPEGKPNLVTLDLRNVDVHHALTLYSKETGENIIVSKDIYGKITVQLKNVTPAQAFEAILKAGNCTYKKEKDVIKVYPLEKGLKIQYLPGGLINRTFSIEYVSPDDVKTTLVGFLSPATKIITTPGTKMLIVEGTPDEINKAESLIKNIDAPPRQVMVEAKIIEIKHSALAHMGVNLKYTNPSNPSEVVQTVALAAQPTATGAQGLYYSVTSGDIEALLEALQTKTGYNLLASPKVLAIEGEEAEIIMGSRLGYKTKTVTTTGLIEGVEFLDVGTKLVMKPNIKDDEHIIMEIHPEVSEGSIINELPQKNSTETTTKLLVKNGQTIIIGGLFKDSSQKVNKGVPFLSEVPFLGTFFRRTELTTEKRELVIFITPHIVTPEMMESMEPEMERIEKQKKEERYHSPMDLIK